MILFIYCQKFFSCNLTDFYFTPAPHGNFKSYLLSKHKKGIIFTL